MKGLCAASGVRRQASGLRRNSDDELSVVAPCKQQVERGHRLLEPVDDMILPGKPALGNPRREVGECSRRLAKIIDHDEASNGQALHEDSPEVARPRHWPVLIVGGDHSAQRHAAILAETRENGIHDRTADIFEIHVDTCRVQPVERDTDILVAIVDRRIKPQRLGKPAAFFRAAGNPDHLRALDAAD